MADKHNLALLRKLCAGVIGVFFLVIGGLGFQKTSDPLVLVMFVVIAAIAVCLVYLAFFGVSKILDTVDRQR